MEGTTNRDDALNELNCRHRKEKKELQSAIQSLKKSATKGDRKKRKEILEEISRLEIDLEKKQADQLNELQNKNNNHDAELENAELDPPTVNEPANEPRVSKAQKRRNKKAQEEKQREAEIEAQEEQNRNGGRSMEIRAIYDILKNRNLTLHSIPSDGDCLYNAILHQLKLSGRGCYTVEELRNKTAYYIHQNKTNLIMYMTNPTTGDIMTDDEFSQYCDNIRNTSAWGGQVELKALSSSLRVPIEVLQANCPSTIQGGEYDPPNLVVTFHRLMYSLGEHYNSTKPLQENSDNTIASGDIKENVF